MGVTAAAAFQALRSGSRLWLALGVLGTLAMAWPLYNAVFPVPAFPGNLWPYIVLGWIALGAALLVARPAIGRSEP